MTLGLQVSMPLNVRLALKYPQVNVVNLGLGNDTTSDMYARRATIDLYNPFRVVVWGGVNDAALSVSAATIETNLQSIYDYCKVTKGYEVWAVTITPVDTNTSEMNTVRTTVNTWIRALPSNVDRVIDAWTAVRDPMDVTKRLAAYAVPADIVHLNDLGQAAIAALFP
jgi:lysophospholipase L1-like esterase